MQPVSSTYLRNVQYATPANLDARANLHRKYGRGDWFPWLATQADWPQGSRVLELGCGPGWFWEAASDNLPDDLAITLTDLSDGMVEAATQRVAAVDKRWTVCGRQADAARLSLRDQSFDIVLASHMLYHVPNPGEAIAEMARVLAPGGLAVVATNGLNHLKEIEDIQAQIWPDAPRAREALQFGLENGGALLSASFAQVELRRYHDDLACTAADDVLAYITSSLPASDATPAQRRQLEAAVAAAFVAGDGTMKISKDAGVFLCRR